ncbi:MAG: hypothetical protein WCI01_00890 [Chlorobiaceae bacterium]
MKKSNKIQRIITPVLAAVFLLPAQPRNSVQSSNTAQINQSSLITRAEKVFTYSFDAPKELSVASAGRMASRLMDAGIVPLTVTDQRIACYSSPEDASVYFEQDLGTGNLSFTKSMRKYYGSAVPQLPSPEEADKIAREYLQKYNLMPANAGEIQLVHKGGLRASQVIEGKKGGPIIDKMITLTYGRVIDGVSVVGPGSKLVVNIGNAGEITGVVKRWREINLLTKTQLRPEQVVSQAEGELELRRLIATEFGREATYEVKSSGRAYYDGNGKTLQPVFIYETRVSLGKGNIEPFNYLALINIQRNPVESVRPVLDERAKASLRDAKGVERIRPLDKED